jgi:DNA-directed RNA polymerase specialized sigma24 family protein
MRDDEGFAAYVDARGQHLVRVAYLLTGDQHLAQDLVQGVLSRAMLSWGRLSQLDDVDAYLRRAVVNGRTSWWRRVSRHESSVALLPVAAVPAPSEDRAAMPTASQRSPGLLRDPVGRDDVDRHGPEAGHPQRRRRWIDLHL